LALQSSLINPTGKVSVELVGQEMGFREIGSRGTADKSTESRQHCAKPLLRKRRERKRERENKEKE
jgi:hypothetical protein